MLRPNWSVLALCCFVFLRPVESLLHVRGCIKPPPLQRPWKVFFYFFKAITLYIFTSCWNFTLWERTPLVNPFHNVFFLIYNDNYLINFLKKKYFVNGWKTVASVACPLTYLVPPRRDLDLRNNQLTSLAGVTFPSSLKWVSPSHIPRTPCALLYKSSMKTPTTNH